MLDGEDTNATIEVVAEGSQHQHLRNLLSPLHRADIDVDVLVVVVGAVFEAEIDVPAVDAAPKDEIQTDNVLLSSFLIPPMMD